MTDDRDEAAIPEPDRQEVVYCAVDGVPQQMDLDFPAQREAGALPAVVYVHGGAWVGGGKAEGNGPIEIPELCGPVTHVGGWEGGC